MGTHGLYDSKMPIFSKILLIEQGIMEYYKHMAEEQEDGQTTEGAIERLVEQAKIMSNFVSKEEKGDKQ